MIAKKYVEDMAGTLRDQSPRETQYKVNKLSQDSVLFFVSSKSLHISGMQLFILLVIL
jgi:hypothetical protein